MKQRYSVQSESRKKGVPLSILSIFIAQSSCLVHSTKHDMSIYFSLISEEKFLELFYRFYNPSSEQERGIQSLQVP